MAQSPATSSFVDQAFIGEVEIEAKHCLVAATGVDTALRQSNVGDAFRALHSLLVHAGMISKFLWPSVNKPKDKAARMAERAERLRLALALSSSASEALANRDLRNSLEHFDERLDDWGFGSPRGLIDRIVGPPNALANFESSMKLRHYDPKSHTYFFADQRFDVHAIVAAAQEVLERVPAARKVLRDAI